MRFLTLLLVSLALLSTGLAPSRASGAPATPPRAVYYKGQLMGSDGKPFFGIVHLTFSLQREAKGGKKIWSENQYVTVENGSFTTRLGQRTSIPASLDLGGMYIAMGVPGGPEFFREKFVETRVVHASEFAAMRDQAGGPTVEPVAPGEPVVVESQPVRKGAAPGPAGGVQQYAEKAGTAYEAEHARNSDRLENLTLKDLEKLLKDRLKAQVGGDEKYSELIGGQGGASYLAQCPKGYFVTGIRGGAGKFVDGIQLICSPIE
jgi:hypothetical protein